MNLQMGSQFLDSNAAKIMALFLGKLVLQNLTSLRAGASVVGVCISGHSRCQIRQETVAESVSE